MTKRPLPDIERLRRLLTCDPNTGQLFWRERPAWMFRDTEGRTKTSACRMWNGRYAGKEAFTAVNAAGYRVGGLDGRNWLAHRIIWAMSVGSDPEIEIDHINGVPDDNRVENLRLARRVDNARNVRVGARNTSGFKGVSWNRSCMKWSAHIRAGGKSKYLGLFESAEDAHAAYVLAASRFYGEFACAG